MAYHCTFLPGSIVPSCPSRADHFLTVELFSSLPASTKRWSGTVLLASLALKLWSIERKSHIMALVADDGLGLFSGLNAIPKKSFLSEYSSRITPQKVATLLGAWHGALAGKTILPGESFNLDFHSVPYFGGHPLVQAHYLPKRSRRQPSILTFLAQDADSQVFCYSNAGIRKGEEADEVFRFIDFWTRHHGNAPRHLVFDSKLTTYAGLDRLDEAEITFMTLRRRSPALLKEIVNLPASAWRTVTLDLPQRKYRTPRVYEQKVCLRKRTFRQFFIKDLGHDEPTILVTNDRRSKRMSTDHTLCKAHADRERARRCRALLSDRCAIVLSRSQGRLRHGPSGPRKRAISANSQPHARLPGCAGPSDLQGLDRHAGRYQHQPAQSHGALPPPRPPPDRSCFRPLQKIRCGSLVEGIPAQICRIGGRRPPVLG
jgi:hypothetical protein